MFDTPYSNQFRVITVALDDPYSHVSITAIVCQPSNISDAKAHQSFVQMSQKQLNIQPLLSTYVSGTSITVNTHSCNRENHPESSSGEGR